MARIIGKVKMKMHGELDQVADLSLWERIYPDQREVAGPVRLLRGRDDGTVKMDRAKESGAPGICGWSSPYFDVCPGQYYRFAMQCQTTGYGYWEAQFYEKGADEPRDFYTNVYPDTCGSSRRMEWFFSGKYGAERCRIVLWPGSPGHGEFTSTEFRAAGEEEAGQWFRKIMEPVEHVMRDVEFPTFDREYRSSVRAALEQPNENQPSNIVFYGDSVGYDVGNLPLDVYLGDLFPQSSFRIHTGGGSGAKWDELSQPSNLENRVLQLDPDLVLCQGVSTEPRVILDALPRLIDGIRAGSDADVLLMTSHRSSGVIEDGRGAEYWDLSAENTRQVGRDKDCGVVDLRALMKNILAHARPPADRLRWYMRDEECHLNDRGRAVVMRLLLACLSGRAFPRQTVKSGL
ncbi:MAG: SGNH/GDSL hydrolase family protein [Planctomycetota bacterium]